MANGLRFSTYLLGDGEQLALLLHGFPDNAESMIPLMQRLAEVGYRTAAPYMRGYAPTDAPGDGCYLIASLARDAVALAEHLGPRRKVLLVGHDWGAVAAYAAANLAPERFSHIVTMSVPPLRTVLANLRRDPAQLRRSWYIGFFQLPLVPERRVAADDFALIERLWRDWSPDWEIPQARLRSVKDTLRSSGTLSAALAYYRQAVRPRLRDWRAVRLSRHLAAGRIEVPGLVLAGQRDGCMGSAMYRHAGRAFASRCVVRYVDAGHFLPLEATDEVADHILALATTWDRSESVSF